MSDKRLLPDAEKRVDALFQLSLLLADRVSPEDFKDVVHALIAGLDVEAREYLRQALFRFARLNAKFATDRNRERLSEELVSFVVDELMSPLPPKAKPEEGEP